MSKNNFLFINFSCSNNVCYNGDMNINLTQVLITAISSGTVLTFLKIFIDSRKLKSKVLFEIETKKLEIVFRRIDEGIQPFLFFRYSKKETNNTLPDDFQKVLLLFSKIIEDNPYVGLTLGTQLKEYLKKLTSPPSPLTLEALKYNIEKFSIYYCHELRYSKKVCKFPTRSLTHPSSFGNLPVRHRAIWASFSDSIEDFAYIYALFSCFLLFFVIVFLVIALLLKWMN